MLIDNPGILTTVQDLGRVGHRSRGINPSGVMDRTAAVLINTMLGNDENEAVLEMHFPAPEIEFENECSFAIGGADFGAELDGRAIRKWSSFNVSRGSVLRFGHRTSGARCYLAAAGGLALGEWLGSRSTNMFANVGGYEGRQLRAGDRIGLLAPRTTKPHTIGPSILPKYSRFPTVRIDASGEFELLTAISERSLLSGGFTVSIDSNRMGYRLSGPPLHLLHHKEMVSAAVTFGTIQLLPDAQLIVLMADHQTAGGYPRIANVISADLPLLAQLGPNDGVSFHLVSIEEAELLSAELERDLCRLRTGIRLLG
ncbi:MAG: biotin-dependent carboxyltransferase family protein [bacterium]|nr:biotin-dependent carboxyltransferase family protein [bacterium]